MAEVNSDEGTETLFAALGFNKSVLVIFSLKSSFPFTFWVAESPFFPIHGRRGWPHYRRSRSIKLPRL